MIINVPISKVKFSIYQMAVILDLCVKMMCKLPTDVIPVVVILVVDLSKTRGLQVFWFKS